MKPQSISGSLQAAAETIWRNSLEGLVTLYLSDGLDSVGDEELKSWDFVVGNPPHFDRPRPLAKWNHIGVDIAWRLHKRCALALLGVRAVDMHACTSTPRQKNRDPLHVRVCTG